MNGSSTAPTAFAVVAIALGCATPAAAEPADEPAPWIPPVATIGGALAQTGSDPAGPLGLPNLAPYATGMLLGQNPAPAAPGGVDPAAIPALSAFVPGYLLPQNLTPAAPGEGEPAPGIAPNADIPGTGRIAFLRRLHEMYSDGTLRGAFLGQQTPDGFLAAQQELESPPPG